ncbi:MAG: GIY-YIG nuclease family protein [Crocinitomix sp.]|nr:GIY-YIG nuclease family protein [Crocinitomix sp.]
MKVFQVYMLECSDDTYYVGLTSDLLKRLRRHESGFYENSYTASRLPVKLVFNTYCFSFNSAMLTEKQIKKWSRAKKEALIQGKFDELPNLSKKVFD